MPTAASRRIRLFVAQVESDQPIRVAFPPGTRACLHASGIGRAMLSALARPIELDGGTARISASIGLALFPDDGEDAAHLLCCADRAMYAAKHAGRNLVMADAMSGWGDRPER